MRRDALLAHFVRDYTPTRYGLAQAVARLAQDTDSPDEAADLEAAAGQIMTKPALVGAA